MNEASTAQHVVDEVALAAARYGWPGWAVAVVTPSGEHMTATGGFADLATRRPTQADTLWRIGSSAKTVTGLLLMQLVEEGRVSLDDPVDVQLPWLNLERRRQGHSSVLLRHLVSHTSGLGELRGWRDLVTPHGGIAGPPGIPALDLRRYYDPPPRLFVPPNEQWRYSNHGIALVGAVVERHRAASFASAARDYVLSPTGMEDTHFDSSSERRARLAVGYGSGPRPRPHRYLDIGLQAAGSATSSVRDMQRYLRLLLGHGTIDATQVLGTDHFRSMQERLHQPNVRETGTGVVFWLDRFDQTDILRHGGQWMGFRSALFVAPDAGAGVWLGVNCDTSSTETVAADAIRGLLNQRPAVAQLAELQPVSSRSVRSLAGRYLPTGALYSIGTWIHSGGVLNLHASGATASMSFARGSLRVAAPLLRHPDDPGLFVIPTLGRLGTDTGMATLRPSTVDKKSLLTFQGRTIFTRFV